MVGSAIVNAIGADGIEVWDAGSNIVISSSTITTDNNDASDAAIYLRFGATVSNISGTFLDSAPTGIFCFGTEVVNSLGGANNCNNTTKISGCDTGSSPATVCP